MNIGLILDISYIFINSMYLVVKVRNRTIKYNEYSISLCIKKSIVIKTDFRTMSLNYTNMCYFIQLKFFIGKWCNIRTIIIIKIKRPVNPSFYQAWFTRLFSSYHQQINLLTLQFIFSLEHRIRVFKLILEYHKKSDKVQQTLRYMFIEGLSVIFTPKLNSKTIYIIKFI
jgi:hypothetical protein